MSQKLDRENSPDLVSNNDLEKINQNAAGSWDDALRHQNGVSENNHLSRQPNLEKEIFEKIATIDKMCSDSDTEKALVMSLLSQAFLIYGDYISAEKICLKSLRLSEKMTGKESYETIACLNSLAKTYKFIGDYENEIVYNNIICKILERNPSIKLGPNITQNTVNIFKCESLAELSQAQIGLGLIDSACENADKSLALARTECAMDSKALASSLQANAKCAKALRDYKKSKMFLNEALKIIEPMYLGQDGILALLEEDTPDPYFYYKNKNLDGMLASDYMSILSSLSQVDLYLNNIKEAENNISKFQKVDRAENAFSKNTIDFALLQEYQCILYELQGNHAKGSELAFKIFKNQERLLASALDLIDSQRLAWQRENLNFTLPVQFCAPSQLAEYVLRWKGVVLDSLIIDRKNLRDSQGKAFNKNLQELTSLKQRLAQLEVSSSGGNEAMEYNKKKIRDSIASIERSMAQKAGAMRQKAMGGITLSAVKNSIPDDTVLIEFVAYNKFPDKANGVPQLGVLIIRNDRDPEWVSLGESRDIELHVQNLLSGLQSDKFSDESVASILSHIYKRVWEPLAQHLGNDVKRVILSPDGPVSFIPFMSLVAPDGKFLCERYDIAEVGSGRDLLQKPSSVTPNVMCVIANPSFDSSIVQSMTVGHEVLSRAINWSNIGSVKFPPLPGTEKEASMICDEASNHGVTTSTLMSEKATKAAFLALKPSKILHVATHGFYLEGGIAFGDVSGVRGMTIKKSSEERFPPVKAQTSPRALNPMQKSGLALAGAGDTIKAWQAGKQTDPRNDGILTAEEVAGLDLNGTWLVTLSACETGVGHVQSGEGVFGLRRAFMIAGAQNLLMTLWPVSDETTPKIMADFYKEALATHDAAGSLAKVQRDWLVKLRKEKGLLVAVRDAGPFAMVVMAKQDSTFSSPSSALPIASPQASPQNQSTPAATPTPTESTPAIPAPPTAEPSPSPTPVQALKETLILKKAA